MPKNKKLCLKNLQGRELRKILDSTDSSEQKQDVVKVITARRKNNEIFLNSFFNQEDNMFWRLAKWQLYREGKAEVYGHGEHLRFSISDSLMVFDKMMEVKERYDLFLQGKNRNKMQFESMIYGSAEV